MEQSKRKPRQPKLTPKQVKEIRAAYATKHATVTGLMLRYGVSHTTIYYVTHHQRAYADEKAEND